MLTLLAHFQDRFRALLEKSEAAKKYANFMKFYRSIEGHVFSLKAKDSSMGFPHKAVIGYHSKLLMNRMQTLSIVTSSLKT
uniref:Uncharacterized protein n=1 Tax=Parascaris univalens TaxID=6257 RepID=A0A914ZW33_PARUN